MISMILIRIAKDNQPKYFDYIISSIKSDQTLNFVLIKVS